MTAPRWACALLRRVAPAGRAEDVLGDLEEAHRNRIRRRGRTIVVSWLDFKLALRMLVKYPCLTLVGGLAIAVGAAGFEFLTQMVHPTLPLDDGDRIVGIRNWDAAAGRVEDQAIHDFVTWREELESVENLGAFRTFERNLIIEEGQAEPVQVAEISASAFRLARVRPLLGRSLVEADERAGTLPVVIG